jgi:Family of unknown function (DUF6494)
MEDAMDKSIVDDEKLTGEIRKFLKKVGITSQIEIENAVRRAAADGRLGAAGAVRARMVLHVPDLGLEHVIEHELTLR